MNRKNKLYIAGGVLVVVVVIVIALFTGKFNMSNEDISGFLPQSKDEGCEDYAVYSMTTGKPCVVKHSDGSTSTVGLLDAKAEELSLAYARIQSDWVWRETRYNAKGWAPARPAAGKPFTLVIASEGKITVTGDCNSISGQFMLDRNIVSAAELVDELAIGKIDFSPLVMTKKFCEKSVEQAFVKDLESTDSYVLRTNELSLNLPDNKGVMLFSRKIVTEGQ